MRKKQRSCINPTGLRPSEPAIAQLPKSSNGRPYLQNGETVVDVPERLAGEVKKEILNNNKIREEKNRGGMDYSAFAGIVFRCRTRDDGTRCTPA